MPVHPVQFIGKLCWLPSTKPAYIKFPPGKEFRALAKFTSDYGPSYTVLVNYSSAKIINQECYDVKLSFPFASFENIGKLEKNSEVLIMEGYKVLAVCRTLRINEDQTMVIEQAYP